MRLFLLISVLMAGLGMGWALMAEETHDPLQGWSVEELKAEVLRLRKQIVDMKRKRAGKVTASGPNAPAGSWLIDDFENETPTVGSSWWTGCDQNNMGTTVTPDPFERLVGGSPQTPGYCGGIKGHLGPNEDPWAWVALIIHSVQDTPTDLNGYKALEFYTKGDGRDYGVRLERDVVKDYAHFQFNFTASAKWTKVHVALSDFAQPNWGKPFEKTFPDVKALAFYPVVHEADYDLKVDDIIFIK